MVADGAGPSEGAPMCFGWGMFPCTCYGRGMDPVDGHVSADVKDLGALEELLVLDGLFPGHPDHGLLQVRGRDFFSL